MMVRELERGAMKITPDKIMMEGETVLTQYIIPYWNLEYVNKSNIIVQSLVETRLCQQIYIIYINIVESSVKL